MFKPWWGNIPVISAPNCSFVGGGRHDWTSGGASVDLGSGRVVQIVHDVHRPELAIVTDCNAQKQITVYNPDGETSSCGFESMIKPHISPEGRLDLRSGETLDQLSTYIKRSGFEALDGLDLQYNNGDMKVRRRDVPDFFCGCKLYYPGSTGVKG